MLANVNSFPFAVAITSSGRMGAPTALREAAHGPQYENTGGLVRVGGPPGTKIARDFANRATRAAGRRVISRHGGG
jgi:hypothetical protein